MSDQLNAKIEAYYMARSSYDAAKAASDEAYSAMRVKEAALVDYMLENGIKSVDRDDGTKPLLAKATSISVTQDNYEQVREWLRETVGDDADFLVTIPHKPAILEYVKKQIEKEKLDDSDFPAFLQCSTRPTLRVNGWKGRE
jgi:hypothetical protein